MKFRRLLDRFEILLTAVLILLIPVVILVFTLGFLLLAEGLAIGELSTLELVELYVIDLILFTGGSYLLYRLLKHSIEERLPAAMDRIERQRSGDGEDGQQGRDEAPRDSFDER